jgi:glucosylceramidase
MKSPSILATAAILQVASAQAGYGPANNSLTFEATIHIDASKRYQTMIGGGCSGAFGAACTTNTLIAADQETVVETLFSENIGGLSVLRNLIGSSKGATILPQVPATPASPANYTSTTSINNDSCQLILAQTALQYFTPTPGLHPAASRILAKRLAAASSVACVAPTAPKTGVRRMQTT